MCNIQSVVKLPIEVGSEKPQTLLAALQHVDILPVARIF